MHCYDTYRSTVGILFTVTIFCLGTKYDANLEIMSCQVYFFNLSIHQDPQNNWRVPFKILRSIFFLRASRLSRSASIRVHVEVLNGLTSNNSL